MSSTTALPSKRGLPVVPEPWMTTAVPSRVGMKTSATSSVVPSPRNIDCISGGTVRVSFHGSWALGFQP